MICLSACFKFNWSQQSFALGLPFTIIILVHQGQWALKCSCFGEGRVIWRPLQPIAFESASKRYMHFFPIEQHTWGHFRHGPLTSGLGHGCHWSGFLSFGSSSALLPYSTSWGISSNQLATHMIKIPTKSQYQLTLSGHPQNSNSPLLPGYLKE